LRCSQVVDELVNRGHEIHILCDRPANEKPFIIQNQTPNIYRILYKRNSKISLTKKIYRDYTDIRGIEKIIKVVNPDLIYFWHMAPLSNAIFPYLTQLGIKMVYDEGGSGLLHLYKVYQRWMYFYKNPNDNLFKLVYKRTIMQIIYWLSGKRIRNYWEWPQKMIIYYNSASSLMYAKKQIPFLSAKIIYSGIKLDDFTFNPIVTRESKIKIILPGRITPIKGTMDGIDLLHGLRNNGINADLTIVGFVDSKEYLKAIQERIIECGLSGMVKFLPMQSHADMVHLFHMSDICYFPSYQKFGLSRIPLEAMACGCLVIAYGNEGSSEIIADGHTGFVVDPQDFNSCIALINDYKQSGQYKSIRNQARVSVEQNYSFQKYINNIEELLLAVVGNG